MFLYFLRERLVICGTCDHCSKGILYYCGNFYRCDFCGFTIDSLLTDAKTDKRLPVKRTFAVEVASGQISLFDGEFMAGKYVPEEQRRNVYRS